MQKVKFAKAVTPGSVIAARIFYIVAASAFAIALGALIVSGHDTQVLMNSSQGFGVLANGYQALQELIQAVAIWLVMVTAGLISTMFGLVSGSFK